MKKLKDMKNYIENNFKLIYISIMGILYCTAIIIYFLVFEISIWIPTFFDIMYIINTLSLLIGCIIAYIITNIVINNIKFEESQIIKKLGEIIENNKNVRYTVYTLFMVLAITTLIIIFKFSPGGRITDILTELVYDIRFDGIYHWIALITAYHFSGIISVLIIVAIFSAIIYCISIGIYIIYNKFAKKECDISQ